MFGIVALLGILPTTAVHAHGAWYNIFSMIVFVSIIRASTLEVSVDGILTVHVSTRFEAGLG
jgi:hypothetical protein